MGRRQTASTPSTSPASAFPIDPKAGVHAYGSTTDAIHEMLDVIAKDGTRERNLSMRSPFRSAAQFLARAAVESSGALPLTYPGDADWISERAREFARSGPGETREVPGLYRFFTFPLWSQGIYDLLVSKPEHPLLSAARPSDRSNYDEGLAASRLYDFASARGAKNAPYAFVSGRLFSKDIRTIYERLAPAGVDAAWHPRGDFGDFGEAGWTRDASQLAGFSPLDYGRATAFRAAGRIHAEASNAS